MNYTDPLNSLAFALHDCYRHMTEPHEDKPSHKDCEVFLFQQMWPSTSCGFGGISGQAFTKADTVVIIGPRGDACIYIAGRFAYYIRRPNDRFTQDLERHRMLGARDIDLINEYEEDDEEGRNN